MLDLPRPPAGEGKPAGAARDGRWGGSAKHVVLVLAVSVLSLIHAQATAFAQDRVWGLGQGFSPPLVVTQLPAGAPREKGDAASAGMLRSPFGEGARILVLEPPATGREPSARILAPGFHSAADPDVSFDGRRVLFAGKRSAAEPWTIYEATLADGGIRQVTHGLGDCRCPSYQGLMYMIMEENPWYQITFVRTEPGQRNEAGTRPASSIYSCKLDGSFVQRLTYNLSSDFDPAIMPDGRLVFACWQRATWDRGLEGRITLMGVNTDGIDPAAFCGEVGRRVKHMPCATAGGLAVFVEADRMPWDGAGMLSAVALRRPLHSYRPITGPADGLFHSPSALPDGTILVSRRPGDGSGTHGVYRMDLASKRMELLFDDPRWHDVQARALGPRSEPDGRSSALIPDKPLGKFYCLDVSKTDFKDPTWLARGTARKVRVLEGIARRAENESGKRKAQGGEAKAGVDATFGFPLSAFGSTEVGVPQLALRRILGEAPIAEDGSFNVEVPANTPIQLQLLDEKGMALRSCGWIWTRNHEPQGCIGCHEDGELTPVNLVVKAVTAESVPAYAPEEKRPTIDFRRDVMPIITGKCLGCHKRGGSPPCLEPVRDAAGRADADAARWAYQTLCAPQDESSPTALRWKYVDPGRARTSPLVWHVFGANTSRPWDGAAARPARPIEPGQAEPLSPQEQAILVQWIDLGATWDRISDRPAPAASQR